MSAFRWGATGTRCSGMALVFLCSLACSGWFGETDLGGVRYDLRPVSRVGGALDAPTLESLASVLDARMQAMGTTLGTTEVKADRLTVYIPRSVAGDAPARIFAQGAFGLHRVDELQTRGARTVMRDQLEAWGFGAESSPEELREALWEADILRRDRWVFYGQQAESRDELLVVEKTPFMDHRLVDQVAVVEEPGQPESCQVEIDSSESSQVAAEREGERLGQRRVVMLMDGELLWVGRLGQLFDDEGQVRLSSPFNQRGAVASAGRPLLGGSHVWNDDGQVHDSESVYSWCQAMVGSLHTGPLDHPLRVLDLEAVDAVQ